MFIRAFLLFCLTGITPCASSLSAETPSVPPFEVKDLSLAPQGRKNIELAELEMGALMKVRERYEKEKPFAGLTIGMALHVTKETAVLIRTFIAGGARVAITGCNPLSTQDDVAAALAQEGVNVWATKGETTQDYYRYLNYVIQSKPNITIDDGCDLVSEIHLHHTELIPSIIGGAEETTTGVIRLRAMEKDNALKYPIIAVNDSDTKHLMDNIKGTGQSTLDGIIRATNTLIAGKTVVVVGYGNCGKGFAQGAAGLNAHVIVTEVNPFKALQAIMDGFRVMPMEQACKKGDIFVTLTGDKRVIRTEHIKEMKSGAMLANSGHFNAEIDIKGLEEIATSKRRIRPSMEEYTVNGKKIFLLGEGRLINLAAAEGHPSAIMSMSFVNQCFACEHLVKNMGSLANKVYVLPAEKDLEVAQLQLEAMNVTIDTLTDEQVAYLASWQEGT